MEQWREPQVQRGQEGGRITDPIHTHSSPFLSPPFLFFPPFLPLPHSDIPLYWYLSPPLPFLPFSSLLPYFLFLMSFSICICLPF